MDNSHDEQLTAIVFLNSAQVLKCHNPDTSLSDKDREMFLSSSEELPTNHCFIHSVRLISLPRHTEQNIKSFRWISVPLL